MSKTRYVKGDYNVICDVCGFQYKASQTRLRWDKLLVCEKDWEPRHPQDYVRAVPEKQGVPIARPDQPDRFINKNITPDDL